MTFTIRPSLPQSRSSKIASYGITFADDQIEQAQSIGIDDVDFPIQLRVYCRVYSPSTTLVAYRLKVTFAKDGLVIEASVLSTKEKWS